jgi:hypothetical protein
MFKEKWVEPGLHGYCHPLKWRQSENALIVDGKDFSLDDEIYKSQEIFKKLIGKEALIFQWTGDCLPDKAALSRVDKLGILNINGGDCLYDETYDSLLHVSPLYRNIGPYVQVYTSASNENIYTNQWKGPFYGFRNVIQTFEKTEHPRRLVPVNIYYHWYTGELAASVQALREIFDWCDSQALIPIDTTYYVKSVLGFKSAKIVENQEGWHISKHGHLKTLRFENEKRTPVVSRETGIMGYVREDEVLYLHLHDQKDIFIQWEGSSDSPQTMDSTSKANPYLHQSTCVVHDWTFESMQNGQKLNIELWGHRPSEITFKHLNTKIIPQTGVTIDQAGPFTTIKINPEGHQSLSLSCLNE